MALLMAAVSSVLPSPLGAKILDVSPDLVVRWCKGATARVLLVVNHPVTRSTFVLGALVAIRELEKE